MVRLAIRDDDTNFFTKVEDLELVYKEFNGFPISFAVIPSVLDVSIKGACSDTKGNSIPRYVGENGPLVDWLKEKLKKGECDILLHGINHNYKVIDGVRYAEMQWRDNQSDLLSTIEGWKQTLSTLFEYPITCFVAPSNKITKYCLHVVESCKLDFSGIVPMKFNERFTIKNIYNYIHRWIFRAVTRLPYPGVYHYTGHSEVNACLLQSYEYLVKMFDYCDNHNLPMAINVHYWALRDKPQELEMLRKFVIDYAIPHDAIPTKLTDLFEK